LRGGDVLARVRYDRGSLTEGVAVPKSDKPVRFWVEAVEPRRLLDASMFDNELFLAPGGVVALEAGDVNGDGRPDIVVAGGSSSTGGTVSVQLNLGGRSFGVAEVVHTRASVAIVAVALADVDGDRDLDLVVAYDSTSSSLGVLRNNGGTFASPVYTTLTTDGERARSLAVADVDGDGDLDAVVGTGRTISTLSGSVAVARNNGTGTMVASPALAAGGVVDAVRAADLDADGDLDLAAAVRTQNCVTVFWNDGGFSAGSTLNLPADSLPSGLAAGDLDGDGDNDLAVLSESSETVQVLLNGGGRTFGAAAAYSVFSDSTSFRDLTAADVDADGDLDLLAPSRGTRLLENLGGGTFVVSQVDAGDSLVAVRSADFDGDARPDLLAARGTTAYAVTYGGGAAWPWVRGYAPGSFPTPVPVDLDGDTDLDLVVSHLAPGSTMTRWISVYRNRGDGRLSLDGTLNPNVVSVTSYVVADFDTDGDPDVGLAGSNVVLWNRDGSLSRGVLPDGRSVSRLWADMDGDGDVDDAGNALGTTSFSWKPNDGSGGVAGPAVTVSVVQENLPRVNGIVLTDADRDGDVDAVMAHDSSSTGGDGSDARISVWLNDGLGNLTLRSHFAAPPRARGPFVGDVDGDGDVDILSCAGGNTPAQLRLYTNDGTFRFAERVLDPGPVFEPRLLDLDGDGDLDVAYTPGASVPGQRILQNDGAGNFASSYAAGRVAGYADLDRDGDADALLQVGTDAFGVLTNRSVVDVVAPSAAVTFRPEPVSASVPSPYVAVDFSENVLASLSADDLVIRNADTGTLVPASAMAFGYGAGDVARFWSTSPLPDGRYVATVAADRVRDVAGNSMAGDVSVAFHFFRGDMNNDGRLDNLDIAPFVQALTDTAGFVRAFGYSPSLLGDMNGDGQLNNLDISAFVRRLTTPTPPSRPTSALVRPSPRPVASGVVEPGAADVLGSRPVAVV
jgi:hypothetical protein